MSRVVLSAVGGIVSDMDELLESERVALSLAGGPWRKPGLLEVDVREQLDLSMTAYYQLLNSMVEDPRVYAADPMTVKRLQQRRGTRQRARSAALSGS